MKDLSGRAPCISQQRAWLDIQKAWSYYDLTIGWPQYTDAALIPQHVGGGGHAINA